MKVSSGHRIFLSASVPLPSRNATYFNSADVIAIRDAVRALTIVILEKNIQLVFGGHPAISPMIRLQIFQTGKAVGEKVVMFQSRFFKREFPTDNAFYEKVVYTKSVNNDRDKSLDHMRSEMLSGAFLCGIFIGGMEGIEAEYGLFSKAQPGVPTFPIASTGAAAKDIFVSDPSYQKANPELMTEFSYISLMRSLISSVYP